MKDSVVLNWKIAKIDLFIVMGDFKRNSFWWKYKEFGYCPVILKDLLEYKCVSINVYTYVCIYNISCKNIYSVVK